METFRRTDPTLEPARVEGRRWVDSLIAQDARMWGGWYQRHDGEMQFLGDHFPEGDETSYLLLLVALALLVRMLRTAPAAPIPLKPARPKPKR